MPGQRVAFAIQFREVVGGILAAADRLRHLGIARVGRQPRRRLVDLPAGHAVLCQFRRLEHLRQQVLALAGVLQRLGRERRQARLQQCGVGAGSQFAQQVGCRTAKLDGLRGIAATGGDASLQQFGFRHRTGLRHDLDEILPRCRKPRLRGTRSAADVLGGRVGSRQTRFDQRDDHAVRLRQRFGRSNCRGTVSRPP